MDKKKIEEATRMLLEAVGENPNREGLRETPSRVARMYEELFYGLGRDAEAELERTFDSEGDDLVVEKDINFHSVCEHHLLPFFGEAYVAYIPDGKIVGLSKIARAVRLYAAKPQVQERLTREIADAIMKYLNPKGVLVIIEAEHMCMSMRGVKAPGTKTRTMTYRGVFEKLEIREDALKIMGF